MPQFIESECIAQEITRNNEKCEAEKLAVSGKSFSQAIIVAAKLNGIFSKIYAIYDYMQKTAIIY